MKTLNCTECNDEIKCGFMRSARLVKGFDGEYCKVCAKILKKDESHRSFLLSTSRGIQNYKDSNDEAFVAYFKRRYGTFAAEYTCGDDVFVHNQIRSQIFNVLKLKEKCGLGFNPLEEITMFLVEGINQGTYFLATNKHIYLKLQNNTDSQTAYRYDQIHTFDIEQPSRMKWSLSECTSAKITIDGIYKGDLLVISRKATKHIADFMGFVIGTKLK